ncbi:MAG: TonB-dependent receptor, partial [Phenylobacterium sp.]|nr:TonB-dependent receptor [Phenylobacterium sp.]
PVTNRLQAQLAARFEDYGGQAGTTFDPKVSLRYRAADWIAFRGSASTTFRAPPLTQRNTEVATSLQSILGSFRTIDIQGDPALKPETATTYSVGVILTPGDLRATVDFWRFDFQNPIATEPVSGLVSAVFPNGASGANNCANPAFAALVSRFTFNGACSAANISRLLVRNANGSDQSLAGVDVGAEYRFRDVWNGDVALGVSLTHVSKFEVDSTEIAGIEVAPAFDGAGALNAQTNIYPMPDLKASAFAEWSNERVSVRWTLNYIGEMEDRRAGVFDPLLYRDQRNQLFTVTAGQTIKAFVTHDLAVRAELPWETRVSLSASNVFDKAPPFARLSLNYDPFTASSVGRVVKLAISKRY